VEEREKILGMSGECEKGNESEYEIGINFVLFISCDFSLSSYSADDTINDFALNNFNISHDFKWVIPLVKAAIHASSAHINFFLTPWVCVPL
jgi:hypothetical protein